MIINLIVGPIIAIVGFILIFAILQSTKSQWRECIGCGRYFNENGEITTEPPLVMNTRHGGVCHECARDLSYREKITHA